MCILFLPKISLQEQIATAQQNFNLESFNYQQKQEAEFVTKTNQLDQLEEKNSTLNIQVGRLLQEQTQLSEGGKIIGLRGGRSVDSLLIDRAMNLQPR